MPIRRVPVVHRFGIISHSKRLELQERLARKVVEEGLISERPTTSFQRNSEFAIDEGFVKQYNELEPCTDERFELHCRAEKIFTRAKRKAGLRDGGIGSHVSLNQAWIDLSLLAQCNSRCLQDGALKSLYISLSYSPISRMHVKSLLQLAYGSIQWLTESSVGQPYLRTGELSLLKVAHLIFLRLYYHHLAGDIVELHRERMELTDLVQAFENQQEIYRPFPASLLVLRIIVQINTLLKVSLDEELKNIVEEETEKAFKKKTSSNFHSPETGSERGQFEDVLAQEISPGIERGVSEESIFHDATKKKSDERFLPSVASIHDTAPTLWHTLNLWRILTHTHQDLDGTLKELVVCSLDFVREPLLDSILALHVMTEICKLNHDALEALQYIAQRDILGFAKNSTNDKRETAKFLAKKDSIDFMTQDLCDSFGPINLRDGSTNDFIDSRMKFSFSKVKDENETGLMRNMRDSANSVPSFIDRLDEFLDPKPIGQKLASTDKHTDKARPKSKSPIGKRSEENKHDLTMQSSSNAEDLQESQRSQVKRNKISNKVDFQIRHDNWADSSKQHSEDGSDERLSEIDDASSGGSLADLSSLASDQPLYEFKTQTIKRRMKKRNRDTVNEVLSSDESEVDFVGNGGFRESPGMQRESSLSIEIFNKKNDRILGSAHTITRPNSLLSTTRTAKWPWELLVSYVKCLGEICINGNKSQIQRDALMGCHGKDAGLLNCLKFQLLGEAANTDWSWRVRHVAVHELMKVCHLKKEQMLKDGLQNAAWTALLAHHSLEKDRRVLEAYKIARNEVSLDSKDDDSGEFTSRRNNSIYSRISTNLAIIHLTPLESEFAAQKNGATLAKDESWKAKVVVKGHGKGDRSTRSEITSKKETARVSLRDEILISSTLEDTVQSLSKKSWKKVQTVVEDQWRKELIEEYEIIDKKRQENIDNEMSSLRKSLKTDSLKERI